MRIAPALLLTAILASLLGACYREYVPVMRSTMLVAPIMWYGGRWSRPMACATDRVYFSPGSAEISPETAACLRTKINLVRSVSSWLIIGSADHQEADTEEARINLMRQRGENVIAFFLSQGLTKLSPDSVVTAEDGYLARDGVLSALDYHQEFRVVILY